MLWYTPVLQMVGSMYDCFEDPNRLSDDDSPQHFLVADPDLNCNPSSGRFKVWRTLVHINSFLIVAFVEIGLPAAIFWKIKQLQRDNKLTADSSFASLYQYYTPDMPFFEVVHMIRKALLILFMSTLATHPIAQAVLCFIVNAGFVAVLWKTKPLVFFPCTLVKNQNLYLLSEMLGACVTLAGSFLALVGAASQSAVNALGTLFAVINISFTVLFFYGFHVDMHRSDEGKKSLLSRNTTAFDAADGRRMSTSLERNDSLKKKLNQSVKAAEEEWDHIIIALGLTEGSAKDEVISGMRYARSVVVSAIKTELVKVNRKFKTYEEQKRRVDEKDIRRALAEYKSLLHRVNADYAAHTGTPLSSLEGVENIAKKERLDSCLRLLKEQRVVVKKTSTLGLTDEIEMVSNPSANLASSLRKKKGKRPSPKVKKQSDDDDDDGSSEDQQVDLEKGEAPAASTKIEKADDDKKPQAVEMPPPSTSLQPPGEAPAASTKPKKADDDKKPQVVEKPPSPPSLQPPKPPPEDEKEKEEVKNDSSKDAQIDVEEGPQSKSASKSQVVEAPPPKQKPPMIKTLSSKPAVSVTALAKKFENAATL
ncbi:hypothetical protein TrVE_jg8427 [Triparma verrucosa]|nr:hypothetical protein TrVE_jg8427 [Triparma verrucosa]